MSAEPARTTTSAKGRTILRPRFTVGTPDLVRIEPGRTLICPARPGQRVQIIELSRDGEDATIVVLEVTQGMGTPRKAESRGRPGHRRADHYTLDPGYFAQREFPPPVRPPGPTAARPSSRRRPQDEDGRSRAPRARVLPAGPLTGYNPAWRQLAAATAAPARCSLAVTRYGVRSS